MKIRKTTMRDLARVMEIYAYARKFMAQHGNPNQWGPTCWPPEDLIRRDITEGSSYVCESDTGDILGTFFLCRERILSQLTVKLQTAPGWMTVHTGLCTGSPRTAQQKASALSA